MAVIELLLSPILVYYAFYRYLRRAIETWFNPNRERSYHNDESRIITFFGHTSEKEMVAASDGEGEALITESEKESEKEKENTDIFVGE